MPCKSCGRDWWTQDSKCPDCPQSARWLPPRQIKPTFDVGAKVIYSFWWYGRKHKHDGHHCQVVKQWVKVAGKKPRNFYKYRLLCIEPGCSGTEFNMEDSSSTCQSIGVPP